MAARKKVRETDGAVELTDCPQNLLKTVNMVLWWLHHPFPYRPCGAHDETRAKSDSEHQRCYIKNGEFHVSERYDKKLFVVDETVVDLALEDVYTAILAGFDVGIADLVSLHMWEAPAKTPPSPRGTSETQRAFAIRLKHWLIERVMVAESEADSGADAAHSEDGHEYYARPMSKREIGIALGLADDRKIARTINEMFDSWGGQLHAVNRTNYLLPLDVLPAHFMDRFRQYVKDFHHVDL